MDYIVYILILILLESENFYKDINTIYSPTSYDYIINKNNKLEKEFIPDDLENISLMFSLKDKKLRKCAKVAFENMARDAKKEGYNIVAVSAFRDYNYQEKLFLGYKEKKGTYYAELCSARPGHSEHQTGLSVDIADLSLDYDNFENTKEFNWVKNNAYKYGFILRYPKAKFHITGFKYEPWHYRYVGIDIAKYIFLNNLTLEEYKKDY